MTPSSLARMLRGSIGFICGGYLQPARNRMRYGQAEGSEVPCDGHLHRPLPVRYCADKIPYLQTEAIYP
jgi:hypothetical protein